MNVPGASRPNPSHQSKFQGIDDVRAIMGRKLLGPVQRALTTRRGGSVQLVRPRQAAAQAWRCLSTQTLAATASTKPPAGGDGDVLCSVDAAPPGGQGTVATVTLSNPRRLNSLSRELIAKLTSTLRSLASEPDVRCVVIQGAAPATGKSPSFTTGANIFEMTHLKSYDDAKKFITELHHACQAMRNVPVPAIARIDGLCLGGGLELAASCDFRYATSRSTFGMPETKFGIPSVVEARLLANIIGWQRTKEMVYFAKSYDAVEMERWWLVDQSCESAEELDEVVMDAVTTISSFGRQAMREQKRLVRIWEESDLVTGIEAGVDSYARMFNDGGSEPAHYMKVFTERKK